MSERLGRYELGAVGLACPRCGAPLQLRAIVWPPAALDVLRDLWRSAAGRARAPPLAAIAP